ncbi:MAG: phosphatidate cytidylyltransferase [Verrucomicrobiota bacterium]
MSEAAPSPTPPAGPTKAQVFAKRLISTLSLWVLVAAAIIVGKAPLFFVLLGLLGIAGVREFIKMDPTLPGPWRCWLTGLTVAWFAVTFSISLQNGWGWSPLWDMAFIAAAVLGAFLPTLFRPLEGRATLWAIIYTIAGFLYVPWLSSFMTRVLFFPGTAENGWLRGLPYLVFLIGATKFTDCGAYVVGSLIGKNKMIPHISPGKTWEGMIGAALGAVGAGLAVYFGWRSEMPLLTPLSATVMSLVLAAVCVVGDLAESVIKRCLGVKDSGKFLPGIGGALDLIDSLLFTAPVFYFYLWYVSGK